MSCPTCTSFKTEDFPQRVHCCEWLLHQQNNEVIKLVMEIDEAGFSREGVHNRRNTYFWSDKNSHAIREYRSQNQC
jgi:hypothetical protein